MKPFNKDAKRVTLTAKVDLATKRHFQELCAECATSPSTMIADMVRKALIQAGRIADKISGGSKK